MLFAETAESESRQQSAAQADCFCTHSSARKSHEVVCAIIAPPPAYDGTVPGGLWMQAQSARGQHVQLGKWSLQVSVLLGGSASGPTIVRLLPLGQKY